MKYITLILFGVFLSGCASIPEEYVGDWRNGRTQLTIKKRGGLNYITPKSSIMGGKQITQSEWGIQKITNKEISGLLPFTSIDIEGPPKKDENGLMYLLVEGRKLYWTVYRPPEPKKTRSFVKHILNDIYCKKITWKSSDCE
jgi:hypothetical protein